MTLKEGVGNIIVLFEEIPGDIWTCFQLPYFKRFRLRGWRRQRVNLLI